jgi:hypothetical protein
MLNLGSKEKKDSEILIDNLSNLSQAEIDAFILKFANSGEPAWHRFVKGAYNHPVTWWIGIFQLQMQMGVWGHKRKANANLRSNALWQITKPLRDVERPEGEYILANIVKYNFRYKKADITGRLAGGVFTNYASTGGRLGRKLKGTVKHPVSLLNFIIASYGAAIKAMASGNKSIDSVIQSVLTGRPETLPLELISSVRGSSYTEEEMKLLNSSEMVLSEVMALSQLAPPPIPIKEFCERPENINLTGLCKN